MGRRGKSLDQSDGLVIATHGDGEDGTNAQGAAGFLIDSLVRFRVITPQDCASLYALTREACANLQTRADRRGILTGGRFADHEAGIVLSKGNGSARGAQECICPLGDELKYRVDV